MSSLGGQLAFIHGIAHLNLTNGPQSAKGRGSGWSSRRHHSNPRTHVFQAIAECDRSTLGSCDSIIFSTSRSPGILWYCSTGLCNNHREKQRHSSLPNVAVEDALNPWTSPVGNYYMKYCWEYFMKKKMHNIFLLYLWTTRIFLGNFLLFVGQGELGENYLTYSHIWGPQNAWGKKCALHIRDIQALPNISCMR